MPWGLEGFEHMMYSFTLFPGGGYIARFFSGELTLIRLTTLHIAATIFIPVPSIFFFLLTPGVAIHYNETSGS